MLAKDIDLQVVLTALHNFSGQRTADRIVLGPEGEKYIAVTDNGVLQIYGQEKLAWTKLSETAEHFTHNQYTSKVIFDHAVSRFNIHSSF